MSPHRLHHSGPTQLHSASTESRGSLQGPPPQGPSPQGPPAQDHLNPQNCQMHSAEGPSSAPRGLAEDSRDHKRSSDSRERAKDTQGPDPREEITETQSLLNGHAVGSQGSTSREQPAKNVQLSYSRDQAKNSAGQQIPTLGERAKHCRSGQQRSTSPELAKSSRYQPERSSSKEHTTKSHHKRRSVQSELKPDMLHVPHSAPDCIVDPASVGEPKSSKHKTTKRRSHKPQLDCGSCMGVAACQSNTNNFDSVITVGRVATDTSQRPTTTNDALASTRVAEADTTISDTKPNPKEAEPATTGRESSATHCTETGTTEVDTSGTAPSGKPVVSVAVGNPADPRDGIQTDTPATWSITETSSKQAGNFSGKGSEALSAEHGMLTETEQIRDTEAASGLAKALLSDFASPAFSAQHDGHPCVVPTFKAPLGDGQGHDGLPPTEAAACNPCPDKRLRHPEEPAVKADERRLVPGQAEEGSGNDLTHAVSDTMSDVTWDLWRENIQAAISFRRRTQGVYGRFIYLSVY